MRVLIVSNSINGIYNFREELVDSLLLEGYEVLIAAPEDEKTSYFEDKGCKCLITPINRRGTNPFTDFKLLLRYFRMIKKHKPNVILTYTIKPNVYGGLASRLCKVPYITNVTGLGTSIESGKLIRKLSLFLYKIGLKGANYVFFQNKSNMNYFVNKKIVDKKYGLLPGSGVNLMKHSFKSYPNHTSSIRFVFIGRVMKAKGVNELLEAMKIIKVNYPNVCLDIIGGKEENFNYLLDDLEERGIINYHGRQEDVRPYIKRSHALINPSYHEGMSNVLLEAASAGRPILASDVPGCKEALDQGVSGFTFEVKNVNSLVGSLTKFIELSFEEKKTMGVKARHKMEEEFDRNLIVNAYLKEINKAVNTV
ncbi:glycosyltransferase family 4 protein [Alkalibacillus haloalkaliphilus]|uniref:Glycosyl transferase n=1 Tax=Alkalibacillus haloalkaliphilus TaxID=94136 RepID=A0A511W6E6_9BACI|nr:glycosyltransferase family 4 protein [Alkalibacillus haloalkaliphilus]GEN46670.1 glycosyl transferase [Alkalibacillus haloalkaliphilus]